MCKCMGKTAGKPTAENVNNALLSLFFVLLQPVHIVGLWNDSKTRYLKIRSERTCEEWNGEPVSANVTSTSSSNIGRQKLLKQKYLSLLFFLPPTNFSAMPTFWTIYSIVNVGTSCMVSLFNFWKWTIEHEGNQKYCRDFFSSATLPLPPAQLHLWSYCRWYLFPPSMGWRGQFSFASSSL